MNQDVIVLGLGAMGSAACYQLAKRGLKVTGIEQFSLGHSLGSSHGQSRMIRKAYFEHVDYVPLLERSYELWRELELESAQKLYHETGIMYFCEDNSPLMSGLYQSSKTHNIPLQTLGTDEFIPYRKFFRAPEGYKTIFEPQAGFLEVEKCVLAYQEQSRKYGAILKDSETVLSWAANSKGVEVVTEKSKYQASKLVVTAGAWSGKLLADLGLKLNLLRKTLFWFDAKEYCTEASGFPCFLFEIPSGRFYGFPKSTTSPAGLKVAQHSGGEPLQSPNNIDRSVNQTELANVTDFVTNSLPGCNSKLMTHEVCMYTMTPDENFIIDLHPNFPNVSYAAGFSGHGFKFSSVMGEILADLAIHGKSKHPIEFLRNRWSN